MLKFITTNPWKFKEVSQLLAPIKIVQAKNELDEIQGLDAHAIMSHKLKQAFKHSKGPFLVEDDSLYLDCLGGKLPGPLIRWFNDTIGTKGLYNLTKKMEKSGAKAQALIGLATSTKEILYFEGNIKGKIVKPAGSYGFGFDPVFQPTGKKQTLSQLKLSGNFSTSPRGLAIKKLKKYLQTNPVEK